MDLLGSDALHSEDIMRKMWGDSMRAVNCNTTRITYDDFLLLMKGQTRDAIEEAVEIVPQSILLPDTLMGSNLVAVPEGKEEDAAEVTIDLPLEDKVLLDGKIEPKVPTPSTAAGKAIPFMPITPIITASDKAIEIDTPLSMDDDNDMQPSPPGFLGSTTSLTPPATPTRSATGYISPLRTKENAVDPLLMMSSPDRPMELPNLSSIPRPAMYVRKRSRSFDDQDLAQGPTSEEVPTLTYITDARRAVALPEHYSIQTESIIGDKNMSALQVNRQIYRAHRLMRISVLEASKRFEEQQTHHARDVLLAQQADNDSANKGPAGLVMRRVANKTVSTEAIKSWLEQNQKEQVSLMEVANRRGGRGRRTRKKTISDIGGMFGSLSQDDMTNMSMQAAQPLPSTASSSSIEDTVPSVIETSVSETVDNLRPATVPGQFRKVRDPFGSRGKYGGL
jgi:hypothetical protein